jgi:hypothetical protein
VSERERQEERELCLCLSTVMTRMDGGELRLLMERDGKDGGWNGRFLQGRCDRVLTASLFTCIS